MNLPARPRQPTLLAQLGAALLYLAVAEATALPLPGHALGVLLQPASGIALVLLILGGTALAPALFFGSLLGSLLAGDAPLAALAQAMGALTAAWVACVLLLRQPDFDTRHPSFKIVQQVLLRVCGAGAGAGALTASTGLVLAGHIAPDSWGTQLVHCWLGSSLGMLLTAPLALSYLRSLRFPEPLRRVDEGILVWVAAMACAVAVFGNTQNPGLAPLTNAYWMFLFVIWSGARLGLLSTMALLCVIALQALWGTYQRTGFFADDLAAHQGFGYWSFMMILTVTGLSLSAYMTERRRQKAALQVAAIAFECQEGMLVTNAQGVILQANQSFLRSSGYALQEVLGRTPHFLLAPPAGEAQVSPDETFSFTPRHNLQRCEWHQRKSGETYPVRTTLSPVRDPHARITHYVLTLTDITDQRAQEERQRTMEQAHRKALVQEVHHRIKNNLQGVMGMLRTLDHKHPRLHGAINQVIGQVHSIAVIHGLQGSTTADQVRLGDLICAVAGGVESLWHTPIHVDTALGWQNCHITPTEAVPVALVLNELILNAVKHGGKSQQDVRIRLDDGQQPGSIRITIANPGHWPPTAAESHGGLGLVAALMPRSGARMTRIQKGEWAVLHLDLAPPVITVAPRNPPSHDPPSPSEPCPPAAGGR